MARSTGPIITAGAITTANRVILHREPVDWRVVTATGLTAGIFALIEKSAPELAVGIAWIGLLTVLLVRTDPKVPSPTESFVTWWNEP